MMTTDPRFAEVAGQMRSTEADEADGETWVTRSQQQMESTVREFPGMAVAAALATGVVVGWLVKRL
jgi:ElaB/YqjD/DUF883 family membrane-anchored ribosome-binding protein